MIYFQDAYKYDNKAINYSTNKIQYNDILNIQITSKNPEAVIPYNFDNTNFGRSNLIETLKFQGYLVSAEGTIVFPTVGPIKVIGKTTSELEEHIETLLADGGHVKDALVNIKILNSKVTVLGEVMKPGTFTITEENITFLQAIGYAGDLTINADRTNLLLIRDVDGIRKIERIDLTDSKLLDSPAFFIKQNDVIVVSPNLSRIKSTGFVGNIGTLVTISSIVVSTAILLSR
ncbi:polysaccharide biosynthesis/export family protein [Flavobacteriaceae bacterium MHTCC 0001]